MMTCPGFEAVAQLVSARTGLSFTNRRESAEMGMRRAMQRARLHDPGEYAERLDADPNALDDLINELTVGETYFFREPAHFDFVERTILPDVFARRGSNHVLRAWSAGCATGEEPYSLAMLFDRLGRANQVQIAATDIARSALAKARQATYNHWSLRGHGAQAALGHLTPVGKNYQLGEVIRKRVTFAHLNLALDAYPSFAAGIWGMDLILCRNVLIYFDRPTIGNVARRLHQCLADGGWLITASSDPPLWDEAPFEVVTRDDGLFYRRRGEGQKCGAPLEPAIAENALAWEGEAPAEPLPFEDAASPDTLPVRNTKALDDAGAAALHVRELANLDAARAVEVCAQMTLKHPLSAELHFLHAVLLLDAGRSEEAGRAVRRVLYLDRTLAAAHYTLGSILRRHGDLVGAKRAYRNARDLCTARPADEVVPLADGEPAGRLAESAAAELALLDNAKGAS